MQDVNKELHSLLAEARALHYCVRHNVISYEEGKKRAESALEKLNAAGERIAKKYGRKHRKITFRNLGETL